MPYILEAIPNETNTVLVWQQNISKGCTAIPLIGVEKLLYISVGLGKDHEQKQHNWLYVVFVHCLCLVPTDISL